MIPRRFWVGSPNTPCRDVVTLPQDHTSETIADCNLSRPSIFAKIEGRCAQLSTLCRKSQVSMANASSSAATVANSLFPFQKVESLRFMIHQALHEQTRCDIVRLLWLRGTRLMRIHMLPRWGYQATPCRDLIVVTLVVRIRLRWIWSAPFPGSVGFAELWIRTLLDCVRFVC